MHKYENGKWVDMGLDNVVKLEGGLGDQIYAIKTDNSVFRFNEGLKRWYPFEEKKAIVKLAINSSGTVFMLDKRGKVWARKTSDALENRIANCYLPRSPMVEDLSSVERLREMLERKDE